MNRSRAKLLTFAGFFLCSISVLLTIYNIFQTAGFPHFVSLCFFVGGIILITFSLAYYTEK